MSESCTAPVRAWPRCRKPVTFGGGATITNDFAVLSGFVSEEGRKKPDFSHHGYHPDSTSAGLYVAAISGARAFMMNKERRNVFAVFIVGVGLTLSLERGQDANFGVALTSGKTKRKALFACG